MRDPLVGKGRRRFRRGAVAVARLRASARRELEPVLDDEAEDVAPPSGRWFREQSAPSRVPAPLPVPVDDEDDEELEVVDTEELLDSEAAGQRRARGRGVLPPRRERDPERRVQELSMRPVLPAWTKDPWGNLRWAVRFGFRVTAFQVIRAPWYAARFCGYSPRGAVRAGVGLFRWVSDAESREPRWSAIAVKNRKDYITLARRHDNRVHNRMVFLEIAALVVLVVSGLLWWLSPWSPFTRWLVPTVWLAVLGWMGFPADRPVFSSPTVGDKVFRLDFSLLLQGFAAAGLCSLDADAKPGRIHLYEEPHRDGDGWRAVVDLPPSRWGTADEAIARRDQIAAGMSIDETRLHLARVRGTAGSARRVQVWVAERDPSEKPATLPPLVDAATWDFWKGIPLGVDVRGRPITVRLVGSNALIGGIPEMGKTNIVRLMVAAAALDPYVVLFVFDGKGGKDLKPAGQVAYQYESGLRDEVVDHLLLVLQRLLEEMQRRFAILAELDDDLCPDGAITPQISRQRRFRMPLVLLVIDEAHEYFADPRCGGQIQALCTRLAKQGRAVGVMQVLATQNPSVDNIPSDLRKQVGTRMALKTMDSDSSDAILGKGSNKAGLSSAKLRRSDKGVCILHGADGQNQPGADDRPDVVHSHLLTLAEFRKICGRGRQLRIKAGTLAGQAAGEAVIHEELARRRILDDVLDVFGAGDDQLHSDVICARLGAAWPDTYHGWDPTQLAQALANWGVETVQTWAATLEDPERKTNRKGVAREQVLAAINRAADQTTPAHSAVTSADRAGIPGVSDPATGAAGPLDPGGFLDPARSRPRPPAMPTDQDSSPLAPDP